jgi:hypothetical protein
MEEPMKVTWIQALGSAAALGILTGAFFEASIAWKIIIAAGFLGCWMRKEIKASAEPTR